MRRVVLAAVCFCLLVATVAGQSRPTADSGQRPTFRLATRLVEVGVVVLDEDGRPVPGLTADDFRVHDGGKQEPVEFFRVEFDEARPEPAASDSPLEFSNRTARRPGPVTVILFDRLNTAWEDQVVARDQVVGFLRQLRPADRVALYVLESGSVRVVHDFTSDAGSLVRALSRVAGATSRELTAAQEQPLPPPETGDARLDAEIAAWLLQTNRTVAAEFTRLRAESTTDALEAIAGRLAGVAGRKNLVWVSSGFPRIFSADGFVQTMSHEMRRATAAINDANIAIYPVDARGLIGPFTRQTPGRRPEFTTMATTRPNIDTMQALAEGTGGRAFHSSNDISGAIRRAVDDGRAMYVLGYYPSHDRWDSRFREIKVRVARPGVEVRHRKGYLAEPERVTDAGGREDELRSSVRSPLEATGLGLTVRVEPAERSLGGGIALLIRVDPEGVALRHEADRWTGAVDLLVAYDVAERPSETAAYFTVNLSLNAEQRERLMSNGLVVRREVDLPAAAHQLHMVARDVTTGRKGSLKVSAEKVRAAAGR